MSTGVGHTQILATTLLGRKCRNFCRLWCQECRIVFYDTLEIYLKKMTHVFGDRFSWCSDNNIDCALQKIEDQIRSCLAVIEIRMTYAASVWLPEDVKG